MAIEFPINSRYHDIGTAEYAMPDGRKVLYLRRRFLPPSDSLVLLEEHTVQDHERLDLIAFEYFGDPILFWRICDANDAMNPATLLEPLADRPRRIRITLPDGVSGPIS